ncbi:YegS/Rv2252/BmrU family lipid kinase [Pleurocapsales cyanobacterium LEGE 06147]|nr:YegS/Rv2252/BmrU family lipid kinase [Pleurocapsales cyanobacterium LEGE 06147]
MTRKACLIFNPVAGQSDPDRDLEQIKTLLSSEIELDIQLTSKDVDIEQLAREAVECGVDAILAAGGDGTLSATAAALIETNIPLGVISRGTANAFAAALGIPNTIEAACQTILEGTIKKVDTAKCNGKPMLLLTGIGFEAETMKNTSRQAKNRWGMLAYIISGIRQISQFEPFKVELETDEKIIRIIKVGSVTIANAAPPTSILAQGPAGIVSDDGLLDITIVALENWAGAIAASYHLLQTGMKGNATQRDDIGYLRSKRIKVTTEPPQKVALDGEFIGYTPVEVECLTKSLAIYVPAAVAEDSLEKLEGLPGIEIEPR